MTYRQRTKKEPSARGDYIITLTRGFVKFFRLWEVIKVRFGYVGDLWDFQKALSC